MAATRLWDRHREALREEIMATARDLFVEHGFEQTTVNDIIEAVNVSRRSFFRYFGTKEDVLLGDLSARGDAIARALAARPPDEDAWSALRGAMLDAQEDLFHDVRADLALARMMRDTPSLQARLHEKRTHWHNVLSPLVATRLEQPAPKLAAAAIVGAVLSCLDVASRAWIDADGNADMLVLYDAAVASIRT